MNLLELVNHRYPFVMIDKVLEFTYMKCATAVKNVSYNEPWVEGHYPKKPIFPGVLMIEAMGQASSFIFVKEKQKTLEANKYGQLATVEKVKFIKPVFPGDTVTIKAELMHKIDDFAVVSAQSYVEGTKVAEGRMSYIFKEVDYE